MPGAAYSQYAAARARRSATQSLAFRPAALIQKIFFGIDRHPMQRHLVVDVRAGAAAGAADQRHGVPAADPFARLLQELAAVAVDGREAVPVIDDDRAAQEPLHARKGDHPGGGRVDGRALARGDVDRTMEFLHAGEGGVAVLEAGGHELFGVGVDRPDRGGGGDEGLLLLEMAHQRLEPVALGHGAEVELLHLGAHLAHQALALVPQGRLRVQGARDGPADPEETARVLAPLEVGHDADLLLESVEAEQPLLELVDLLREIADLAPLQVDLLLLAGQHTGRFRFAQPQSGGAVLQLDVVVDEKGQERGGEQGCAGKAVQGGAGGAELFRARAGAGQDDKGNLVPHRIHPLPQLPDPATPFRNRR